MDHTFLIPTDDSADNTLIFPVGKFYRDGVEREFTPDDAAEMVANFQNNVLGRLPPVNREHKRELGKIATITALRLASDGVRGDVDGDLTGFDFISPEVRWQWSHPFTGAKHKNVLMGAGATNYPFFLGEMALNNDALLWSGSEWGAPDPDEFAQTERERLTKAREARASRYGISAKDGGNLTPPKDFPENASEYGDPVNYRYPADAQRAQPAVSYFNQAKNRTAGGYSAEEWAVVGRRLARLVGRHLGASYEFADGKLMRKDEESNVEVDEMADQEKETPEVQGVETVTEAPQETPPAEDYSEKYAELAEQFAELKAALETEKAERVKVEEAFTESEKARRLMHFSDVVGTFSVAAEPEQFAEDLFSVEQVDAELAERMIARFRAASEAVAQSDIFSQQAKAKPTETAGDPWLVAVEAKRKESFSEMPKAAGWVAAEKLMAQESPEMARDFAERTRGGQ